MLTERTGKSFLVIILVVGGIITFGLGALSARVFLTRRQTAKQESATGQATSGPLLTEGFDFNHLRASGEDWRGPEVGEKIDLTRLITKDGKTLASMIGQRPVMIVSVNPGCPMCETARDEMVHLRNKLAAINISYYLVCFSTEVTQPDFVKYSDSLNVGSPSFLWNGMSGEPPAALLKMVNPTHLLLNSDGTVMRVWPGSYNEISVRQRMAQQIIADTSVALDTLKALQMKTTAISAVLFSIRAASAG